MERTAPTSSRLHLTLEEVRRKELPLDMRLRMSKCIGKGAYSTVYQADLFKHLRDKVAMKIIRSYRSQGLDQRDLHEIEIMSQIDNPYVNKLIEYYIQKSGDQCEELILLQPLAMQNYDQGGMTEKEAIEFLAQLAIGIKSIHDLNVIHRDFNPNNILVFKNDKKHFLNNQEFILRISDFGVSKILDPSEYFARTNVGKVNYMSPEQNNGSEWGYNQKVDVFALGLTIFQMITGKVLNTVEIISRDADVHQYSTEFIDLLYQLCSLNHEDRPSIYQVIEHPIIQRSQTYINCLLDGLLSMNSSSKIEKAIDKLEELQEQFEAEQQFIEDLQDKYPIQALQLRIQKPLQHSILEIGRVQYNMSKVMNEFEEKQEKWQALYEKAFGNNDKQYFIDKYLKHYVDPTDTLLNECQFKREIEPNGNIFVGFYKENRGQVALEASLKFYGRYYASGQITEGPLSNGKFHGKVCQFGPTCYYEGDFVQGFRKVYGVMLWNHGDMYCGEWKKGTYQGQGTYYMANGKIYEGSWKDNNQHGKGVLKYPNGDTLQGQWNYSTPIGEFIYTHADGQKEKIQV
eukprot:403354852